MMKKNKVIAIVGPTASGKSSLALALAQKLNGEIISADSRQIYKEFNIATAKPDKSQMQGIVHHLIDIVEPVDEYTVADFADDAAAKIADIVQRGKTPIIAGGTGLYFRTLLQDFDLPRVEPDKELREQLNALAEQKGSEALHEVLKELDPISAQNLHPNNTVKIIRAIEVSKKLGLPMSSAQGKKEEPYDVLWIGLNALDRKFIYDRIDARVDEMIEDGLVDEAQSLYDKYGKLPIMANTIGYKELFDYFEENCSLTESIDKIKQNSRRYAKRQLTWFRQNPDINWIDIQTCENPLQEASMILNSANYPH